MRKLEIPEMENLHGNGATSSEACGFATGASVAFIASGALSLLGVAALMVTTAVACR